ncbi:hypothetical protein B0H17DRAFT_1197103 [Mycena rosella]|uniref:Uncharacterized protein n=1 Tax=Mycena rosella TaxID=1033263 RepID=A0AAD7DU73_MYCRO|nr:hypothetical protein B0H17DRAFT_1197103 [Mycena rosella]
MARDGSSKRSIPSAHAKRNPGRAIQQLRHRQPESAATKASKLLKRAEHKRKHMLLEAALDSFFEYRDDEIDRIAEEHSMKRPAVRRLLSGDHPKVLSDLQEGLADNIEDGQATIDPALLDDAEKKRLIEQLMRYRETQKRGVRATNKSAAMDGQQTAHGIGELLLDLFERTGIRGFAIFSRGNPDDAALPHFVASDGSMDEFFQQTYGLSALNVLRSFERYSCTIDDGSKEKNDLTNVRKDIVRMNAEGLRNVSKDKHATMSYDNYDYEIRELKRCEIIGWPIKIPFQRPSKTSAEDARTIRNGFKDGAIFWKRMSGVDHTALVQERMQSGAPAAKRATRSDKGKKRGKAVATKSKGKKGGEGTEEEQESGSEKEGDDEDDEEEWVPASTLAALAAGGTEATAATSAPAALYLTDIDGNTLTSSNSAGLAAPTFNPADFDFSCIDFDGLGLTDFANVPTLDLNGYNFGDETAAPAFVASSTTAQALGALMPAFGAASPAFSTAMPLDIHGGSAPPIGASTSVFAATTNTPRGTKRKDAAEKGGHAKKARMETANTDEVPAVRKRKVRSDAGKPRKTKGSEDTAPARQRAKRSDAGKRVKV